MDGKYEQGKLFRIRKKNKTNFLISRNGEIRRGGFDSHVTLKTREMDGNME